MSKPEVSSSESYRELELFLSLSAFQQLDAQCILSELVEGEPSDEALLLAIIYLLAQLPPAKTELEKHLIQQALKRVDPYIVDAEGNKREQEDTTYVLSMVATLLALRLQISKGDSSKNSLMDSEPTIN